MRYFSSITSALLATTVATAVGLSPAVALACQSDVECKDERICVEGQCIEPAADITPSQTRRERRAEREVEVGESSDSVVGLYFNALGLLQFGISPTIEFGTHAAFFIRGRIMYLGAVSHVLSAVDGDTLQPQSLGAGLGFRYYTGGTGNLRGFYFGFSSEFINYESVEGDWQGHIGQRYVTRLVAPQVELGYRWVFGGGFNLGFGGSAGYGVAVQGVTYDSAGNEVPEEISGHTAEDQAVGYLTLDIGWLL